MSSVSDQLQRNVGKSHNTAAEEDKKKEGEEGRQRKKKVRRDESESETGSGVEGTHRARHSGTLSAARKEKKKREYVTDRQRQCSHPAGLAVM